MGHYQVRRIARLVVLIVLMLPLLATAQPVQVRRIAFLGFGPPPSAAAPRPPHAAAAAAGAAEGSAAGGPGGTAAGRTAGKGGGASQVSRRGRISERDQGHEAYATPRGLLSGMRCAHTAPLLLVRQGQQVLHQVQLFLVREFQAEALVIVSDHVQQRRKAAVMKEPAFLVGPESIEWGGAVAVIGGSVSLEVLTTDLVPRMQIPAGFAGDGLHMAARAVGLATEQGVPPCRGCGIETPRRWLGRRNRQLVKMQRWQFRGDQVVVMTYMAKPHGGGNWKLGRII
jgi:hypothetical protein